MLTRRENRAEIVAASRPCAAPHGAMGDAMRETGDEMGALATPSLRTTKQRTARVTASDTQGPCQSPRAPTARRATRRTNGNCSKFTERTRDLGIPR